MTYEETGKILNEATIYMDMHRYEQALSKLKQLLSYGPNNGRALYLMSLCYFNLNQNEKSLEFCNESLNNGFSASDCQYLLGRIYTNLLNYAKAEDHFLECLNINPKQASALSYYGILMLRTRRYKKALKLMNEAMEIDPTNEIVLHNMFVYYMNTGYKKRQIDSLESYVNTASNEISKLINIGLYNVHIKDYPTARENFRQAFLLDPTNQYTLDLLEEIDLLSHWLFIPYRLMYKAGGPLVFIVGFILFEIIGRAFLDPHLLIKISKLFILFSAYIGFTPYIFNAFNKSRRKKLKG